MISQQASLSRIAGGQYVRVKSPIKKWREVLSHLSSAEVDLQQVPNLVGRSIVAAAVPEVATEEQDITRIAQNGLRQTIIPMFLESGRGPARLVATGNNLRGTQLFRLTAEIEMSRAEKHRDADCRRNSRIGPFHRQVVQMKFHAAMTRVTSPGRFANNVTVVAECSLSEIDNSLAIKK